MSIVGQIAQRRIDLGISQRELARLTGIPQPRIADIESGKHSPSAERLEALAKALGLKIVLESA